MLSLSIITALIVLFIHACTWEGMVFEIVHDKLFDWPEWIKKPLYDCPICMSPWWGSLIHLLGVHFGAWPFLGRFSMVMMVFAAAGLNTVLIYIIENGKNSEPADSAGSDNE